MHGEPDDDHEGENDVERKRNPIEWKNGPLGGEDRPVLVDEHGTHSYIVGVSPRVPLPVRRELKYVPNEPRYMKQGKTMTRRFVEYMT